MGHKFIAFRIEHFYKLFVETIFHCEIYISSIISLIILWIVSLHPLLESTINLHHAFSICITKYFVHKTIDHLLYIVLNPSLESLPVSQRVLIETSFYFQIISIALQRLKPITRISISQRILQIVRIADYLAYTVNRSIITSKLLCTISNPSLESSLAQCVLTFIDRNIILF